MRRFALVLVVALVGSGCLRPGLEADVPGQPTTDPTSTTTGPTPTETETPTPTPDPNLVARYPFDDGTADDVSGNGLHGILRNGAAVGADPAGVRAGLVLILDDPDNGASLTTSNFVDLDDPTGILNFGPSGSQQGSATVMAWVYSDDWLVHDLIFNQGEWRNGISLGILADSGDPLFLGCEEPSCPSVEIHSSQLTLGTGTWHHAAATWDYDAGGDQTTITFYLDGQAAGFSQGGLMDGRVTDPIDNNGMGGSRIGAEWRDNDPGTFRWPFSGRIDELEIYNTVLMQSEIQARMIATQ